MKKKKGIVHPTRALRGVAPTVHECLHVWGSNANNAGLFCTVVVAGSVELMQMVQVQMATATTGGQRKPATTVRSAASHGGTVLALAAHSGVLFSHRANSFYAITLLADSRWLMTPRAYIKYCSECATFASWLPSIDKSASATLPIVQYLCTMHRYSVIRTLKTRI